MPEKPTRRGAIEIELDGGVRLRVDAAVDEEALKRVLRACDDRAAGGDAGVAGKRRDGHAAGLRRAGAAGAGDAEARSALWTPVRVPRQARRLIKVLWHDGQGLCLFAKRLERGRFVWPRTEGEAVTITPAQLGYLLEGIDWRLPQQSWRPEAAG